MKKILVLGIIVAIVVISIFVILYQPGSGTQAVSYESEIITFSTDNDQFTVQYGVNSEIAKLSLSGVQYELEQTKSASGSRYETADGKVVFWEEGGEAMLEIRGEVVIKNAMTARRRVEVLKSNKQGDPDANRYDFGAKQVCNDTDQDCTGSNISIANDGGSIVIEQGATLSVSECGAGTVLQDDVCVPSVIDSDDDGDSIPIGSDTADESNSNSPSRESDYYPY